MAKGVLFDLDGTLLDTARDLGGALNQVLRNYNLPEVDYQRYRIEASNGSLGLLKLGFAERYQDYDEQILRTEFLDIYHDNICRDTAFFPGIETLLSELNKQNIPWGIVTNKPEGLTKQLLTYFDIMRTSSVMVAGDTLPHRKPSPIPLQHAAQTIGLACDEFVYVGDAMRDIEAANAANMSSVLAAYGYLSDKEIADISGFAKITCHDVEALTAFLLEEFT